MDGHLVRPAEARDALGVAALHLQHERELGGTPRTGFLDEVATAFLAGRDHRVTWLAEQPDGRPVGVVHGELLEALPSLRATRRRWMHVSLVFVTVDRRRLGLGERLLKEAVAWARRERLERVCLDAVPPARTLFARLGFAPASDRAMLLTLTDTPSTPL